MTAHDLIYERFWKSITKQSGHIAKGNQLMIEIPDGCG